MIAGLEAPSKGRILFENEDITSKGAERRNFGMVFQSFALFPHMNVAKNIAYSLTLKGVPRAEREARAAELLELVQLGHLGTRRISELSGGQRQRVAITRALAQEPGVFLLDEPMSALDAQLRGDMQMELRMLQQKLGITTVVVTHDQH
jgi:putative spermidine/putrescine transport system ATP-binding protein